MFRAIILPILRGTRPCVTACGIMHPRCCRPPAGSIVGALYYLYQWCTFKQISDNEIYLLIKYIKSVLWRAAKRLSYVEDARCLKVLYHSKLPCLALRLLSLQAVFSFSSSSSSSSYFCFIFYFSNKKERQAVQNVYRIFSISRSVRQ